MLPGSPTFDPYAVLQVVPTADPEVIQAAFRALARKFHPDRDRTQRAVAKMAEVNRAYAMLRDEHGRLAYDRSRRIGANGAATRSVAPPERVPPPVGRGVMGRTRPATASSVLDFGRYRGWSLAELAHRDLDYVLWLSRHSSGVRYRTEIYGLLRTIGVSAA